MNNNLFNDITSFKLYCISCTLVMTISCVISSLEKIKIEDNKLEFLCPICRSTLPCLLEYIKKKEDE